jgi:alkyldihydroxyacetonephosphate synthase
MSNVADRLGGVAVDRSRAAREAGSGDAWPRDRKLEHAGRRPPLFAGVVRPASSEEVGAVLAAATAAGVRLVPVGLGSGICGALSPRGDEIALSLSGLDRILSVDEESLLVTAEAGVRGDVLAATLERRGLSLGHDPQSLGISTVGGWVATRSSGIASTRYGGIEDHVRGLVVALADGTPVELPAWPRASLGPDLVPLFVGSEGTLGVICAATLVVHRRPQRRLLEAWTLPSYAAGLEALRRTIQDAVQPAVARLYNRSEARRFVDGDVAALLLLAHEGRDGVVRAEQAVCAEHIVAQGGRGPVADPAVRWYARRHDASRLMSYSDNPGSVADAIEVAVDWSRAPQLAAHLEAELGPLCTELHLHSSHFYRQGASTYAILYIDADGPEAAIERYDEAWELAMDICLRAGAAIGHHHGVGRVRLPWLGQALGSSARLYASVRGALDPAGILSPERLTPPAGVPVD